MNCLSLYSESVDSVYRVIRSQSGFWSSTRSQCMGKNRKIHRECALLRNNIFIFKHIILLNVNRIAGFSHSYQVNKTAQSETHTHTHAAFLLGLFSGCVTQIRVISDPGPWLQISDH